MRAFIDTSSLIKKYILEAGSEAFDVFLNDVSEIIVSTIYWIELNSAIDRRLQYKEFNKEQALWLQEEARRDLNYFSQVFWNENLEQKSLEMIQKYHLKTLDSLQLAAGCLSGADIFVTSDKKLHVAARKEMGYTKFF